MSSSNNASVSRWVRSAVVLAGVGAAVVIPNAQAFAAPAAAPAASVAPKHGSTVAFTSGTGFAMDLNQASTASGTAIKADTVHGGTAQHWTLWDKGAEGWLVETDFRGGMVLDRDATTNRTGLWKAAPGYTNQHWKFQDVGDGSYQLKNVLDGRCLTAGNLGEALKVADCETDSKAQAWKMTEVKAAEQPTSSVAITFDTSKAPDLASWAADQKKILQEWYPKIGQLIAGGQGGYATPNNFTVVLDPSNTGVAWASGTTINVNPSYVRGNRGDTGFLVHEAAHIAQQYRNLPVYFSEGIADWVRGFNYEKSGLTSVRSSDNYNASYRTTAFFLNYVATHYDGDIVRKLSVAAHDGSYTNDDQWWSARTGKTAQQLWNEIPKN